MGELGNFFTICVVFGNIVRFAGTLTAQTRQDSETTHTGRTPHPPSFAPAQARSPLRGRPLRGRSRAFQHLMSQNLAVLPHFVAVNSQEEGYGWVYSGIVYGGCMVVAGLGLGCGSLCGAGRAGNDWGVVYPITSFDKLLGGGVCGTINLTSFWDKVHPITSFDKLLGGGEKSIREFFTKIHRTP